MSSMRLNCRIALATLIKAQALHCAWGTGPTSNNPDAQTTLVHEIGRRTVTQCEYVERDLQGLLIVQETAFRVSTTPTRHLYLRTDFLDSEAIGQTIKEVGIFFGGVTDPALPAAQRYFTPEQVVSPGNLIHLADYTQSPIYRLANKRERFEFVISL